MFWPGEFHGVHGVTKSWTQLSNFHFTSLYLSCVKMKCKCSGILADTHTDAAPLVQSSRVPTVSITWPNNSSDCLPSGLITTSVLKWNFHSRHWLSGCPKPENRNFPNLASKVYFASLRTCLPICIICQNLVENLLSLLKTTPYPGFRGGNIWFPPCPNIPGGYQLWTPVSLLAPMYDFLFWWENHTCSACRTQAGCDGLYSR